MGASLEIAIDYYIDDAINKIPDSRKDFVREKLLLSKWIPFEELKPPSETRIIAKQENGDVYVEWFYGRRGDGILKITHWKPLIK